MERHYSFPKDSKHFHLFTSDTDIKKHPTYRAAKAGDPEAALRLIEDLADDFIKNIKHNLPAGLTFVTPFAKEATGDNAIPLLLAIYCAEVLQGHNEHDIVQLQRVFHTGADPMERLISRPSFEGRVSSQAHYVLVDDVTSMGGTLAELANYILLNGGTIVGSVVLVNAGRSLNFQPQKKHINLLKERFGDEIRQIFGIHIDGLTANEASYLVGFRTVDEIRNRCVKAKEEIHLRLLSKNHS